MSTIITFEPTGTSNGDCVTFGKYCCYPISGNEILVLTNTISLVLNVYRNTISLVNSLDEATDYHTIYEFKYLFTLGKDGSLDLAPLLPIIERFVSKYSDYISNMETFINEY